MIEMMRDIPSDLAGYAFADAMVSMIHETQTQTQIGGRLVTAWNPSGLTVDGVLGAPSDEELTRFTQEQRAAMYTFDVPLRGLPVSNGDRLSLAGAFYYVRSADEPASGTAWTHYVLERRRL